MDVGARRAAAHARPRRATFIEHQRTDDFRFLFDERTTVALVGDWGGRHRHVIAVARQIRAHRPDHVIHLHLPARDIVVHVGGVEARTMATQRRHASSPAVRLSQARLHSWRTGSILRIECVDEHGGLAWAEEWA